MSDQVYATNAEDFNFSEPEDCLEALWNECFGSAPETVCIFQATDTGIPCESHDNENATNVTDFVRLTYRRINTDFDFPKWELVESLKSASKHVWKTNPSQTEN